MAISNRWRRLRHARLRRLVIVSCLSMDSSFIPKCRIRLMAHSSWETSWTGSARTLGRGPWRHSSSGRCRRSQAAWGRTIAWFAAYRVALTQPSARPCSPKPLEVGSSASLWTQGYSRLGERAAVVEAFGSRTNAELLVIDASQRFLKTLKGVVDPQEKRRRIGHEFIEVFRDEARSIPGAIIWHKELCIPM